ncbi:PGN_0703 family putative restriction endonuclease [Sphingomonas corticis]|jgi:hypothetical protein|uniref:Restriction endonuclease n=1 Tax=Sphingomonas corticis TaxID=2722791 RepID=A0ABX1CUQ6_9SPHN|nr:hypothetical protein [Sphingomonas corticis]NJR80358.1 hypothetical protein [Sphingomonas corticis]
MANLFLPDVPEPLVRAAFARSPGSEIATGKFASPDSSAALAANAFGSFLERPDQLPPFPPPADLDWPATRVDVERQMRFPWSGGRHPWLDAGVETPRHLIGVESKRFEPFRDAKPAQLSDAYDRDVWGEGMQSWTQLCDDLRASPYLFRRVDAAQLVKHAFGLVTEARRIGKAPVLLYLYAEPARVPAGALAQHRDEVARLSAMVTGAAVRFAACTWSEWLATFTGPTAAHARRLIGRFQP